MKYVLNKLGYDVYGTTGDMMPFFCCENCTSQYGKETSNTADLEVILALMWVLFEIVYIYIYTYGFESFNVMEVYGIYMQ